MSDALLVPIQNAVRFGLFDFPTARFEQITLRRLCLFRVVETDKRKVKNSHFHSSINFIFKAVSNSEQFQVHENKIRKVINNVMFV